MKRICIDWTNLSGSTIEGEVSVHKSPGFKEIGRWNITVDLYEIHHFPKFPDKTLPEIHRIFSEKVSSMARIYYRGLKKDINICQWI